MCNQSILNQLINQSINQLINQSKKQSLSFNETWEFINIDPAVSNTCDKMTFKNIFIRCAL